MNNQEICETTLQRVWGVIRITFFEKSFRKIRMRGVILRRGHIDLLGFYKLSFGDKMVESIDRLIRSEQERTKDIKREATKRRVPHDL